MKAVSFIEILEKEIRAQVIHEFKQEHSKVQSSAAKTKKTSMSQVDTGWFYAHLAGHLAEQKANARSTRSASHPRRSAYEKAKKPAEASAPTQRPAPKLQPEPPRRSPKTPEELVALTLLKEHATTTISDPFSQQELKKAWKSAALRIHPDRFDNADADAKASAHHLFQDVQRAYQVLNSLF